MCVAGSGELYTNLFSEGGEKRGQRSSILTVEGRNFLQKAWTAKGSYQGMTELKGAVIMRLNNSW